MSGHWELGEPECGYVLEVVTQPETDRTMGDGKLSFHTGSKIGPNFDSFDVDGGRTTLESPVFSFGDARYPALVFYAWHVGVDFSRQGGPQAIGEGLVVQASNDGGKTWTEIDRVTENTEDWQRRTIPIREHLEPTQRMRFRFSIEDRTAVGVVEAGIDDLEIVDLMDHCEIPPPAAPVGGSQGPSGAIKPASDSGCNGTEVPRSRFPYGTMAVVFGLAAWLRARRR